MANTLGGGGFNPRLKTVGDDVNYEASFLASEHVIAKRAGITVDASTVGVDADGNKILKAGTLMGKITATGKYAAYDNALSNGRETAAGILFETINLKDGDLIAALMLHGSVLEARCSSVDSAAKTDLAGRIIFQ